VYDMGRDDIYPVTNKHTAKLHHVGSLYILTYDARKFKHKTKKSIEFFIKNEFEN